MINMRVWRFGAPQRFVIGRRYERAGAPSWEMVLPAWRAVGRGVAGVFSRAPFGRGICGSRWARDTHGIGFRHVVAVPTAF
jgi:hypothetical protein